MTVIRKNPTYQKARRAGGVVFTTVFTLALLIVFLSPFAYMLFTSFKPASQMSIPGSPVWPAVIDYFEYQGQKLELYYVPLPDGTTKELAAVKKQVKQTTFIDPKDLEAGEFLWQGSWRALKRPWRFALSTENFTGASDAINFPRLFLNTSFYAFGTTVGVLFSCILVAYGFSRFRFPGRDALFMLVISTIFLPGVVTLIPTYTFFVKIGWVGSYLPLIIPSFFSNAYDTFLLRQYMMTIPRELDEAAAIDGATPLQILIRLIIPQSMPAIVAVIVFHIVWAWNDFFGPLIYLSTKPELQPISVALSFFNGIYGQRPTYIQAASLMAMIVPMVLFLIAQRFFIQGVVITGVEK